MKTLTALLLSLPLFPLFGQIVNPVGGGSTVSVTSPDGSIVVNPTPGTGTFTVQASNSGAIPPALSKFRLALAKSSTQVVRVEVFGDSISRCWTGASGSCNGYGPTNSSSLWTNALRTAFVEAGYPSHGTGVIPVFGSISGAGIIDTSAYTMSGTSYAMSTIIGPQQVLTGGVSAGSGLMQMAPGTIATLSAKTGDTLEVYCAEYTDSSAGINVAIDGTNIGTACGVTAGSATALVQSFTAGSGLGSHTAVLTANAGAGTHAYLYAIEWTIGSVGVSVDGIGAGGALSAYWANHYDFSDLASGHALSIVSLGTNDATGGVSAGTYSTNITSTITHEEGLGASVFVLSEPPMNNAGQAAIVAAALAASVANSTDYLSVIDYWPAYANANGQMNMFMDGLHPNDTGALTIASLVSEHVLNRSDTSVIGNGGIVAYQNLATTAWTPLDFYTTNTGGLQNRMGDPNGVWAWGINSAGDWHFSDTVNNIFNIQRLSAHQYIITPGVPSLSSCGTSPAISADSNDVYGTVTIGTTATGCTVSFHAAFTSPAPHCVITVWSGTVAPTSRGTGNFVVTGTDSSVFDYHCLGK